MHPQNWYFCLVHFFRTYCFADNAQIFLLCVEFFQNFKWWCWAWKSELIQPPDLSRRHHLSRQHDLHTFSQKLRCGWENIWRKVVHINHLNNVSSNLFSKYFVRFSRRHCQFSRWHHLQPFYQNLRCGWENIWRKDVHINHLNNVSSNISQIMCCLV
jgi:hypothetical protein